MAILVELIKAGKLGHSLPGAQRAMPWWTAHAAIG